MAVDLVPWNPKVPVRMQREACCQSGNKHPQAGDHHHSQNDLAGDAGPFKGKDVDVEQENRGLDEEERELVEEDAEPPGLCLRSVFACGFEGKGVTYPSPCDG